MYGIEVAPGDQRYIPLLHEALEGPTQALMQGSYLVEHIPILQHVPAWVPGAGFQRKFARWRRLATKLLKLPSKPKRFWVSYLKCAWILRAAILTTPYNSR